MPVAANALALISAASLASIAALMVADVIGRYLFNQPIPGAGEVIELLMAISVFSGLPLTTAAREHIQLDYLELALHPSKRHILRAIISLLSATILAFLAWRVALTGVTILNYGDTTAFLKIPIAPVAFFVSAMLGASAIVVVCFAWGAVRKQSGQPEDIK
jgi:TRAP-type C4-dicarboxylate transport system permease small subunit